jgi:hypothetical protein
MPNNWLEGDGWTSNGPGQMGHVSTLPGLHIDIWINDDGTVEWVNFEPLNPKIGFY